MGVPLLEKKSVKILKTHIAKFAMRTPSTEGMYRFCHLGEFTFKRANLILLCLQTTN